MFLKHRIADRRKPVTMVAVVMLSFAALQTIMQPVSAASHRFDLPLAHASTQHQLASDLSAVPRDVLAGVTLTETVLVALSALAVGMAIGVVTSSRPNRKNRSANI